MQRWTVGVPLGILLVACPLAVEASAVPGVTPREQAITEAIEQATWKVREVQHTPWDLQWSGYSKYLLTRSETLDDESFFGDLSRWRLTADARYREVVDVRVSYDQEVVLGNVLRTDQFHDLKDADSGTWIDADKELFEVDRDLLWRHRLYRGFARFRAPQGTLSIGRQRIAWGKARFWNPVDLFNPVSPLQLEPEEKVGVDAVMVEVPFLEQARAEAVYAPQSAWNKSSLATRATYLLGSYEVGLMGGKFRDDDVLGVEFDGHLFEGGLRGEATFTDPKGDGSFVRTIVGYEYVFPNTLSLLGEYFYNGGASPDPTGLLRLSSPQIFTTTKHFLAGGVGYDITPLFRFDTYAILQLEGARSAFLNPIVTYNLRPNLDVSAGAQLFLGPSNSEYGLLPDLSYVQVQWFF